MNRWLLIDLESPLGVALQLGLLIVVCYAALSLLDSWRRR